MTYGTRKRTRTPGTRVSHRATAYAVSAIAVCAAIGLLVAGLLGAFNHTRPVGARFQEKTTIEGLVFTVPMVQTSSGPVANGPGVTRINPGTATIDQLCAAANMVYGYGAHDWLGIFKHDGDICARAKKQNPFACEQTLSGLTPISNTPDATALKNSMTDGAIEHACHDDLGFRSLQRLDETKDPATAG